MVTIFIITIFVMLFLGFPIFLSLIISSSWYLSFVVGLPDIMALQRFIGGMNKFSLLAVPFFIVAATVMGQGEIGKRLLHLVQVLLGHLYGGLAITATMTCMIIGAISGAGTAGIVTIGPLIYKDMLKQGYDAKFTGGLITTSSSLAMLIPPSIAGIIYAMTTGVSVARIFIAGLGAGLLFGFVLMVYGYYYSRKTDVPRHERSSLKEIIEALKMSGWALGLPIIILGGIYTGVFSPTEAAGVSAVYAILVELLIYKDITLKEVFDLMVKAGVTVSMLYMVLGAGNLLAYSMSISGLPAMMASSFQGTSFIWIMLFMNLSFLIAGMFVDPASAIIILIPLFLPLARIVGLDLIHLGVISIFNLSLGMLTPPFGLNLFVASNILEIPIGKLIVACVPFIVMGLIVLMLLTFIPEISLFFPRLIM